MITKARYQVIIVGGGPVGMGLAVQLGLRGISCAVIERSVELHRIPKGQFLKRRTLELFYFWGIVDQLRAARTMPPGYPPDTVTIYGNLVSDHWHVPVHMEAVRPYYFQDEARLPQYQTEKVLRAKVAHLPTVETQFGWTAESIDQDEKTARVTLVENDGPGRRVLEADYLVGCDGSRSIVREKTNITRAGTDYNQLMILAVFHSRELHEFTNRFPPACSYRVMRPELKGYWQFFGRVDAGGGWFFHAPVPPGARREDLDIGRVLWDAAGFEFAYEPEHLGFWDMRISVADTYQSGRIFIAGDAAHSHPPYGGYGLNSGLEDIVNLGWKLAAVLQGWGGESLLPSYSVERRPVFKETGDDFIAGQIAGDRAWLERYDPGSDPSEFEKIWNQQSTNFTQRVTTYEPNYEGSGVIAGPPGGICSAHGTHSFKARPGHHLTPVLLSSGRNVYEELDSGGFTLLAFDADPQQVSALEAAARGLGIPLKVIRDSLKGEREAYESRLTLVRPDQYVAWTGERVPPDAAQLLRKLVGREG